MFNFKFRNIHCFYKMRIISNCCYLIIVIIILIESTKMCIVFSLCVLICFFKDTFNLRICCKTRSSSYILTCNCSPPVLAWVSRLCNIMNSHITNFILIPNKQESLARLDICQISFIKNYFNFSVRNI